MKTSYQFFLSSCYQYNNFNNYNNNYDNTYNNNFYDNTHNNNFYDNIQNNNHQENYYYNNSLVFFLWKVVWKHSRSFITLCFLNRISKPCLCETMRVYIW